MSSIMQALGRRGPRLPRPGRSTGGVLLRQIKMADRAGRLDACLGLNELLPVWALLPAQRGLGAVVRRLSPCLSRNSVGMTNLLEGDGTGLVGVNASVAHTTGID